MPPTISTCRLFPNANAIISLREHATYVRIDGIPNFFRTMLRSLKLFWLAFVLGCAAISIFLVVRSVGDYLSYQVTTTYRLKSEIRSLFPTVSICNTNPLNTEYYIRMAKMANLTTLEYQPYVNMARLEYYKFTTNGTYLTDEEKRAMTNLDGFIISCSFQNKPCNMRHLSYQYFPYFGNCLRFNDGLAYQLQTATVAGEYNELSVELYVGLPNELTQLAKTQGIYITIADAKDDPFKNTPSPIVLTPGFGLKIHVVRNHFNQYNQWPYKYSECNVDENNELIKPIQDISLFTVVRATSYAYSQDSCLLLCYQTFLVNKCNCTAYWVNFRIENYGPCMSVEQQACADAFYTKVFNIGSFIQNNCLDKCPLQCKKHRFDNYQSLLSYPDPTYVNKTLRKNAKLLSHYTNHSDFTDNLGQNVVKFSLLYDTLAYFEIKEEEKTRWYTLLGSIGGHLHLFLGMSLISFIEVFELTAQFMLHYGCSQISKLFQAIVQYFCNYS